MQFRSLALALFAFVTVAAACKAEATPRFSGIIQCVTYAYSSSGLNMSTSEARAYCRAAEIDSARS